MVKLSPVSPHRVNKLENGDAHQTHLQQSAVGMATLTQCSVFFVAMHSAPSHSGRCKTRFTALLLRTPRTCPPDVALSV